MIDGGVFYAQKVLYHQCFIIIIRCYIFVAQLFLENNKCLIG